jgi:hypothetical protein
MRHGNIKQVFLDSEGYPIETPKTRCKTHSPKVEDRIRRLRKDAGVPRMVYNERRKEYLDTTHHRMCGKCSIFLGRVRIDELDKLGIRDWKKRLCRKCAGLPVEPKKPKEIPFSSIVANIIKEMETKIAKDDKSTI